MIKDDSKYFVLLNHETWVFSTTAKTLGTTF